MKEIIKKLDKVIDILESKLNLSVGIASQGVTDITFDSLDEIREMAREDAKFYRDKDNNPNNLSVEELAAKCYKERVKYPSDDAQDAFYGEFMRSFSSRKNFSSKELKHPESKLTDNEVSMIKDTISKYLSTNIERKIYRGYDAIKSFSHFTRFPKVKDALLNDLIKINENLTFRTENSGDSGGLKVYIFKRVE